MPHYEFRCEKCKKAFELTMTISEREKAKPQCPTCEGAKVVAQARRIHGADGEEKLIGTASSRRRELVIHRASVDTLCRRTKLEMYWFTNHHEEQTQTEQDDAGPPRHEHAARAAWRWKEARYSRWKAIGCGSRSWMKCARRI